MTDRATKIQPLLLTSREAAKDMVILSLGTGDRKQPYPYQTAKNWGALGWVQPVIDIMMSGVSETVDYQLVQIYDATKRPNQYLRIEPGLGAASPAMDDASPENVTALRDAGQKAAEDHIEELTAFVKQLTGSAKKTATKKRGVKRRTQARRG